MSQSRGMAEGPAVKMGQSTPDQRFSFPGLESGCPKHHFSAIDQILVDAAISSSQSLRRASVASCQTMIFSTGFFLGIDTVGGEWTKTFPPVREKTARISSGNEKEPGDNEDSPKMTCRIVSSRKLLPSCSLRVLCPESRTLH